MRQDFYCALASPFFPGIWSWIQAILISKYPGSLGKFEHSNRGWWGRSFWWWDIFFGFPPCVYIFFLQLDKHKPYITYAV